MKSLMMIVVSFLLSVSAQANTDLNIGDVAELIQKLQGTSSAELLQVYEQPSEFATRFVFQGDFQGNLELIDSAEKQVAWVSLISQYLGVYAYNVDASQAGMTKLSDIRTSFLSCYNSNFQAGVVSCLISSRVSLIEPNPDYSGPLFNRFFEAEVSIQVDFKDGEVVKVRQQDIG